MKNKVKNRIVIVVMGSIFSIYNLYIYTNKTSSTTFSELSNKAIKGEVLWQENNCTACHQLYGLGGYLGPDLTNIISHPNKGENYVKSFLNSGIKSMPRFNFSNTEKELIVEFLKAVDKTGYYPNKEAIFNKSGWVSIKYKKI